jgi:alpha-glucan,water dikinase
LVPESPIGEATIVTPGQAAETPFVLRDGLQRLALDFPSDDLPLGLQFVLKQTDAGTRWVKFRGGNFYVPLQSATSHAAGPGPASLGPLADEIIRSEQHHSWTLMHRFNRCHDLLDEAGNNREGLALLYVWLRFSAIRQLTWQRNYNTKPRELAHAQDRLTQKIAEIHRAVPANRVLARLMLGSVGRGGEGQRIRDEILNIMHRHHIKEVSGHFMEEWHQKLHNNTTPDDVVICEAFLEFLRSNGDRSRFYTVLEEGGVTRERLESFERPIRSQPDFIPYLKEPLLHDFGYFLKILKAAHSGTDYETALNAARGSLDGGLQGQLDWIAQRRNDGPDAILPLANNLTEARRRLSDALHHGGNLRELLYLDLALEQLLRTVIERNLHVRGSGEVLAELIARVLENVTLAYEDPELAACSRHWDRLQTIPRFTPEWALHAKAVTDRIARALSTWMDAFHQLLQPKAEQIGNALRLDAWAISLFSEEVVRGNSLGFTLSVLLHHIEPILRQTARLGAWQIISRGHGHGQVQWADSLRAIQLRHFDRPTVILTERVMGDEEIPDQVTAVIAPDVTDIVSHVAVRARNNQVLFAACHDAELLDKLKALQGRHVELAINASGDVLIQEGGRDAGGQVKPEAGARSLKLQPRQFTKYAVSLEEFAPELVGGKSLQQLRMRGKLPAWIRLPASAAVPFGVFEHVLDSSANRAPAGKYADLLKQLTRVGQTNGTRPPSTTARADAPEAPPKPAGPGRSRAASTEGGGAPTNPEALLESIRAAVLELSPPSELRAALEAALRQSGLPGLADWSKAWQCIKQVWASKWNERAWLSRTRLGLAHEHLFMAVLIQQVVPADYAFVIHTVNPMSGSQDELFAEVVLGLGETLVGNFPGRALSFVYQKSTGEAKLHSLPGKSVGLYGGGLIFRSDSNGEDLEGYAGAGLYDSVLLDAPRETLLDYTEERLVWDAGFQTGLLKAIAQIGLSVEQAYGAPQDIEGAVARDQYYVVQTRPQVGLSG